MCCVDCLCNGPYGNVSSQGKSREVRFAWYWVTHLESSVFSIAKCILSFFLVTEKKHSPCFVLVFCFGAANKNQPWQGNSQGCLWSMMDLLPYQNCFFSFLDCVACHFSNLPVVSDKKSIFKFQLYHKPLAYSVCFSGWYLCWL